MNGIPRTLKASEAAGYAAKYAQAMVRALEEFNAEYSLPKEMEWMPAEEREIVEKRYKKFLPLSQEKLLADFKQAFLHTVSLYYAVIPDTPNFSYIKNTSDGTPDPG